MRRKVVLMASGVLTALVVIGAILVIYFVVNNNALQPITDVKPSDSILGNYRHAAVSTNGYLCAEIGK